MRLVYNRALAARTEGWYERQERIDYIQTSALLTGWKKLACLDFLNEVSCVPLQQGLRHLQKAFSNFFAGRTRYPNFKKKRNGGSAEFTRSAFKWKDGQVWLAKCSMPLPIKWSRPIPDGCTPSTVTVKLDARGHWHVSLLVDNPSIKSLPHIDKSIGLDLGITSLIATSDGDKVAQCFGGNPPPENLLSNPKPFKRLYKKLRRVQKALSRTQSNSNNRHKARLKVARVQGKIADSRKDFLHKLTTQLVRDNQTIVVEEMAVKNMVSQRVAGVPPVVATGEPVRVKNQATFRGEDSPRKIAHKLAQSISDAAWSELVRQLDYKCQWYGEQRVAGVPPVVATANPKGRELVKIDRWFPSSKRCGNCGHIVDCLGKFARGETPLATFRKMPLIIREWDCPKCGAHHDRDINASGNILAAGLAVSVCGANIRPDYHLIEGQLRKTPRGKKQKPRP